MAVRATTKSHDIVSIVGFCWLILSAVAFTYVYHQTQYDPTNDDDGQPSAILVFAVGVFTVTIIHVCYLIIPLLNWCASHHVVGTVKTETTPIVCTDGPVCEIEFNAIAADAPLARLFSSHYHQESDKNDEDDGGGSSTSTSTIHKITMTTYLTRAWQEGDSVPRLPANGPTMVIDLLIVRGFPASALPCVRVGGIFWCPSYNSNDPCYAGCCHPLFMNAMTVLYVVYMTWFFWYVGPGRPIWTLYIRPFSLPLAVLHGSVYVGALLWIWPNTLYNNLRRHNAGEEKRSSGGYVPMMDENYDGKIMLAVTPTPTSNGHSAPAGVMV